MKQNETNLVQKSSKLYFCKTCDYTTSRSSQYDRHLLTSKHFLKQNETISSKAAVNKTYNCNCGDSFNSRTTLWRHQTKCAIIFCKEDLNDSAKQQQLIEYLLHLLTFQTPNIS